MDKSEHSKSPPIVNRWKWWIWWLLASPARYAMADLVHPPHRCPDIVTETQRDPNAELHVHLCVCWKPIGWRSNATNRIQKGNSHPLDPLDNWITIFGRQKCNRLMWLVKNHLINCFYLPQWSTTWDLCSCPANSIRIQHWRMYVWPFRLFNR